MGGSGNEWWKVLEVTEKGYYDAETIEIIGTMQRKGSKVGLTKEYIAIGSGRIQGEGAGDTRFREIGI
jgi:hypothetical protein